MCSVTPLMTLWICCRCYSLSLSAFSPVVAFLTSVFVVNESDLWFLFTRVFTLVFKCRRSQRRPTEPPFHLAFCFSLFFIIILLSLFVCIFPFSHTLEGVLDSLLLVSVRRNKAGYTATEVACGWEEAKFEVTRSFGQEQ